MHDCINSITKANTKPSLTADIYCWVNVYLTCVTLFAWLQDGNITFVLLPLNDCCSLDSAMSSPMCEGVRSSYDIRWSAVHLWSIWIPDYWDETSLVDKTLNEDNYQVLRNNLGIGRERIREDIEITTLFNVSMKFSQRKKLDSWVFACDRLWTGCNNSSCREELEIPDASTMISWNLFWCLGSA